MEKTKAHLLKLTEGLTDIAETQVKGCDWCGMIVKPFASLSSHLFTVTLQSNFDFFSLPPIVFLCLLDHACWNVNGFTRHAWDDVQ